MNDTESFETYTEKGFSQTWSRPAGSNEPYRDVKTGEIFAVKRREENNSESEAIKSIVPSEKSDNAEALLKQINALEKTKSVFIEKCDNAIKKLVDEYIAKKQNN